ncbi:hypothetical protein BSL82_02290 [Tardibacter chloracetimidivorans]|uniref:Tape measure protein N-terminal domain-containing protein n=1 Tax=Tardibacter chloracetimidivorans TaxID=1921510 RepID=A0A1L3ZRM4_9SPHN|nr:tape measure protein [Tardibacter chloracetimidivorans]API58277.1 hypothetical protein BSL82_02290 [Tardibacter chloracetimidivorans]
MSDADITARLKLNAQQFSSELNRELGTVETRVERTASQINSAFSRIKTFAGGLGLAIGARELGQLADEYATITSRLRLATAESGSFSKAQADVRRIAGETRTSLSATAELYASMARNGQELGISQDQIARATETVNKAIRVSGGSAASAAAGVTQLGQALASGVLRGDEFNSMMENSPRLAKLLADSLGVPIGRLRKMAEDGELTADKLVAAFTERKFTAGLDQEFKQLPVAFSEAATKIYNAALTVFGEFDQGGQFSSSIANFVSDGSDGFEQLAVDAREAGVEVRASFEGLADAFEPLLAGAQWVFSQIGTSAASLSDAISRELGTIDALLNFADAPYRAAKREYNRVVEGLGLGGVLPRVDDSEYDLKGRFDRGVEASKAEARKRDAAAALNDKAASDNSLPKRRPGAAADEDEKAAKAAERAAEAAEKERRARDESFRRQEEANAAELHALDLKLQGQEAQAELEHRLFQVRQSNKDLSAEQLAVLERQTIEIVKQEQALEAKKKADADAKREAEEQARAAEAALEEQRRHAEDVFRDLGDIYYDIFSGQGGNIWDNFKRRGLSALADLAAQWTLSFLSGNAVGMPQGAGPTGLMSVLFGGGAGGLGGLGEFDGGINIGRSLDRVFGVSDNNALAAITNTLPDGTVFGTPGIASTGAISSVLGSLGAGLGAAAIGTSLPGMFGLKTSSTGGAIGGIGGFIAGGPIGAGIGAALGSVLGGLLKGNRTARAQVTGLDGLNVAGADKGNYGAASGLGGSVQEGLARIIDALGGEAGAFNVTIGTRGDDFRVNTRGTSLKMKNGAVSFEGDQQAAIEFAIRDAIADGAIKGISAAAERILRSSDDLEAAITKASLIESIPKRLKAIDDPLGAAMDGLVDEFRKIKKALDEGGATAKQYADAEKLFNKEREALVERMGSNAQTLKDFQESLKIGSNSPLSLRDQEAAARAAFDPFAKAIRAGKSIDQDAFSEAAQQYLDVSRGLHGSTDAFFKDYERVQSLLGLAISTAENNPKTFENPFAEATANAAQATATNTAQMVGALQQNTAMLADFLRRFGGLSALNLSFVK